MVNPEQTCDLCGLEIDSKAFTLDASSRQLRFCCEGCRGIYLLLNGEEEAGLPPQQPAGDLNSN